MRRLGLAFNGQPYSLPQIISASQAAEDAGFESIWIAEDYWTGRDAISVLSCLAQATKRIRLGTAVINPYTRSPVLIAMTINALWDLGVDRLILGLGAGIPWKPIIKDQMDKWPPLRAIRETVNIVRNLTSGLSVSWNHTIVDLHCSRPWIEGALPPVSAQIPIYIGAYGPRMTELAGEIADGLLIGTGARREDIIERMSDLEAGKRRANREAATVDIAAIIVTSVGENGATETNALRYVASRVANLSDAEAIEAGFDPDVVRSVRVEFSSGNYSSACGLLSSDMIQTYSLCGSSSRCQMNLHQLSEEGVSLPILLPLGGDLKALVDMGSEYILG